MSEDPVREAGKLLSEGNVLAIKGYGGFHIASSVMLEAPLERLRATKHRREKPFAIMAKSLKAARSFAEVSSKEQELLSFLSTPNCFAKQKPKLQFVASCCAEPA